MPDKPYFVAQECVCRSINQTNGPRMVTKEQPSSNIGHITKSWITGLLVIHVSTPLNHWPDYLRLPPPFFFFWRALIVLFVTWNLNKNVQCLLINCRSTCFNDLINLQLDLLWAYWSHTVLVQYNHVECEGKRFFYIIGCCSLQLSTNI